MISTQLQWQQLLPDDTLVQTSFSQPIDDDRSILQKIQPRLTDALCQLAAQPHRDWLLLRAQEQPAYQQMVRQLASQCLREQTPDYWHYQATAPGVYQLSECGPEEAQFQRRSTLQSADWIESEQLFGSLRYFSGQWYPKPGLLHQANGGVLILSLRTLLAQPLLWLRLKSFVQQGELPWLSPDERQPLPVNFAPIPLRLQVILCGDRDALAEFHELEPELLENALYTELEEQWAVTDSKQLSIWAQWVQHLATEKQLPAPQTDFWPRLIREGWRYTEDQQRYPLCPLWLTRQLQDAVAIDGTLSEASLLEALARREWHSGYLPARMLEEIGQQQKLLITSGECVGQINGLSVLDLPGHPRPWGEPSRISCIVHFGDGEVHDIERKVELGGNLHAKGMMIIQAWLMAELELEQQLPFSASIVFEQSYGEVDGDSASLAELVALVSALANLPISQQLAVTGSVDQFGNVQPVGGLNQKIEGFFEVCRQRGLTGQQGVIIPAGNVAHLALNDQVIDAVKAGDFHLYPFSRVEEALELLIGSPWSAEASTQTILAQIQERIRQISHPDETSSARPWPLRWLNWFNRR